MIKKINKIFIFITLIGSILVLFKSKLDLVNTFKILSIFLSINIINILKIKYDISDKLNLVYIVFIILAHFLGVILNFYNKIMYYDKFVHFLFGVVSSYISYNLLNDKNKFRKKISIIIITLSLAALWEIYEYTCSLFFNIDPQESLTTGVNDTMQDIIVAFIGSILVSIFYRKKY